MQYSGALVCKYNLFQNCAFNSKSSCIQTNFPLRKKCEFSLFIPQPKNININVINTKYKVIVHKINLHLPFKELWPA